MSKKVKCKDCIYCIELPEAAMKKLGHDYKYVCAIPFFVCDPDFSKPSCIVDAQIQMATKEGIEREVKCEFFRGWDI